MTLENLKQNITMEKEILRELILFSKLNEAIVSKIEKSMIEQTLNSLKNQFKIINNSIPELVENISVIKKLPSEKKNGKVKGLISLSYVKDDKKNFITIREAEKKKFLIELSLTNESLKRIKKKYKIEEPEFRQFKKPNLYAKISNMLFSNTAHNLVNKGYFKYLNTDLRKANMPFILDTYVSMMLFSTLIFFVAGILLFIVLIFFKVGIDFPFFTLAEFSLNRILINLLVIVVLPILTFLSFYFYPKSERSSIKKRINQELPFVIIHMSAIAGSGIEPSQIFKVIALSKEYKYTRQELKKVINQINVYGYDLVNALKNSAISSSSEKLAELFNGLATTISSGGSLTEFLEKRAETLLFEYRLEREKYTQVAETFMDIYISIVIAAPMIMMLLLILVSGIGLGIGISVDVLTVIILSTVAAINLLFLIFLQLKQPGY